MKSPEYWQKRLENILTQNEKGTLDYEKELLKLYNEYKLVIEEKINAFYAKYSETHGLNLLDVKKRLSLAELKSFRRQQEIYLKKLESLVEKGVDLEKYAKTLQKLSGRAYISKLQELQHNLNTEITLLTATQEVTMTELLTSQYLQGYFSTTFELQKGLGVGYTFTKPSTAHALKVLQTPWSGDDFSSIIWKNKAKLTQWLNKDLPRHFVMGSDNAKISTELKNKLDVSFRDAKRLVRTETNYITNQSALDSYGESGVVKKFQYLATLDSRTSEQCQEMDGKIFKLSEKEVGVTVPPLHPHCRSTTVPYFDDDYSIDDTRIAKNKNGETIYVPANMKYEEWKKIYGI